MVKISLLERIVQMLKPTKSAVSHSKPVAKMHTEMAKMIDPGFREGVV